MAFFYGTHLTKLDSKGRLLVPPSFRAKLRSLRPHDDGAPEVGVVLRRANGLSCIEVWPPARFEALQREVDSLPQLSAERDDLSALLFGDAIDTTSDREGRITLTERMLKHAAITGPAAFMGVGEIFQIWEPDAAEERLAATRASDRARRDERARLARENGA